MKRVAETDTNAYDNAFTNFHALPFALRSSAHAGHATAKVFPPAVMEELDEVYDS